MALLPKPYADELVGSILLRGFRVSGLPLKRFLSAVYSAPRSRLAFVMTSGLDRIALLSGMDAEQLLLQHTVFPYTVAAMSEDARQRFLHKALALVPGVDCLGSLTKSVTHSTPFRRLCPLCVSREMGEFGESYWHRTHLLPGVLLCPEHGVALHRVASPTHACTPQSDPRLPHECTGSQESAQVAMPLLERIGTLSQQALDGPFPGGDALPARYEQLARVKGYVCGNGGVGSVFLANNLYRAYGANYLASVGSPFSPNALHAWPTLMTRPGAGPPFAPIKHILLTAFLEVAAKPDAPVCLYRTPGPKPQSSQRFDQKTAARLRRFMARHGDQGERFSTRELLTRWKAWSAYRHDRSLFPETNAAVAEFKQSNLAVRQVGRRPYWRTRLGLERARVKTIGSSDTG